MSNLHSIVPLEHIFINEQPQLLPRSEMIYHNMLVEVEYSHDYIILSRIINGPLDSYLNSSYMPGTIIGKRH